LCVCWDESLHANGFSTTNFTGSKKKELFGVCKTTILFIKQENVLNIFYTSIKANVI